MKKIFALVLCLMMACSFAMAEELPVVEFNEASIAEIGGEWMLLEEFGLLMYVPDIYSFIEVPEEQAELGIFAILATEDMSAGITMAYGPIQDHLGNQITDHATLVDYYASNGYDTIATCLINGLEATNFVVADKEMMAVIYFLEDGNALSFYYTPISDEGLLALHSVVCSTIMLAQ